MSISQERPTNPAGLFMKVKSGKIVYYDKESQENITVPTPFEFVVLDQLATVKGWSDADESGYWSNEVRSVGRDTLTVRTSKGIKDSGIWREIKGNPSMAGSKYNASVYVAHKSKDGLVISNLALTGAALNAWIEFTQKNRINKVKVVLADWTDAKKGSVAYKVPVFEGIPMGEDEKAEAVELDKQLQVYFNEYFNYVPDDGGHSESVGGKTDELIDDDDITDEPIDLSEIPF
jgi:hypothetical protein